MNEIIIPNWPIPQKRYEILALQELLKNEKLTKIVEIGTWMGGTALLWAIMVSKNNGRLFCCDLSFYYGSFYSQLTGKHYNQLTYKEPEYTEFAKHITELEGNSHDPAYIAKVFEAVSPGTVDFMFIDGDHTYEGVKADFYNFLPLMKPGGYVAFHDILKTADHISLGCRVEEFWSEIKDKFEYWEFVDNNEYLCYGGPCPSKSMGIGVIKTK